MHELHNSLPIVALLKRLFPWLQCDSVTDWHVSNWLSIVDDQVSQAVTAARWESCRQRLTRLFLWMPDPCCSIKVCCWHTCDTSANTNTAIAPIVWINWRNRWKYKPTAETSIQLVLFWETVARDKKSLSQEKHLWWIETWSVCFDNCSFWLGVLNHEWMKVLVFSPRCQSDDFPCLVQCILSYGSPLSSPRVWPKFWAHHLFLLLILFWGWPAVHTGRARGQGGTW